LSRYFVFVLNRRYGNKKGQTQPRGKTQKIFRVLKN